MYTIEEDREAGYRPTVGIILLYHKKILLGHEAGGLSFLDKPFSESEDWEFGWKIPQGGIEVGEVLEQSFSREIREELTTDFCLFSSDEQHWLGDIAQPILFRHERQEFPVTREGVRYRGKSYHYCAAQVGYLEENYDHWVHGPKDDEGPNTSFPTSGFPGGVFFADYLTAQVLIRANHLGRASIQALSVIHELYAKGLLERTGCGFKVTTDLRLIGRCGLWEARETDKALAFL